MAKRVRKIRPYHKYFNLVNRYGVWKVVYKHSPNRQISTGVYVGDNPEETEHDAVAWAYEHMYLEQPEKRLEPLTLKRYTKDFFLPEKCPYLRLGSKRKNYFSSTYAKAHRGRLVNYIWPQFGSMLLSSIEQREVHEWLLELRSVRAKKDDEIVDLKDNSKNKILQALNIIFNQAVYDKKLSENPLKTLKEIKEDNDVREPFTNEEMKQLFPVDGDKIRYIWGYDKRNARQSDAEIAWYTQMWFTYFLTMAITGWRPGEIQALYIEDRMIQEVVLPDGTTTIIKGLSAFKTVDYATKKIKSGIKTRKKGVKFNSALITSRLNDEFDRLLEHKKKNDDSSPFWFHINGQPLTHQAANKKLRKALVRCVIKIRGRSQYSLRHSLATDMRVVADDEYVNRILGHTRYRKEYDHRDGLALLKGL